MCNLRGLCGGNRGSPILAENFRCLSTVRINMMHRTILPDEERTILYDHQSLVKQNSLIPRGGNLLERSTQDCVMIIECNQAKLLLQYIKLTSDVTYRFERLIQKQFQATLPPAFVKAVEEICVTCGGPHPYYQCLAADGNTFPEYQDNIQGYVAAAAGVKYKTLADLGASINLIATLGLERRLGTRLYFLPFRLLNFANRDICTPKGIARDVFVPVGKFTFPADFVIVDYENDPRVPLYLGRPFLRTLVI
ncbi:reverse transcriptase domain-containing protein [Tanacetum coccineum]